MPGIDGAELTSIQAGTLVEETGSIRFNEGDAPGSYLARLQANWNERAPLVPDEFDRIYRWYLNSYDSS